MFGDISSPSWEQLLLMAISLLGFTVVMYVLVRYAGRAWGVLACRGCDAESSGRFDEMFTDSHSSGCRTRGRSRQPNIWVSRAALCFRNTVISASYSDMCSLYSVSTDLSSFDLIRSLISFPVS